ncbi:hypothetical protein BC829DRAFT_386257 [Chytridium lagenaria]|nr:hypothetical protein BC829DRAFT_386257 [Chytridium lagenaria]
MFLFCLFFFYLFFFLVFNVFFFYKYTSCLSIDELFHITDSHFLLVTFYLFFTALFVWMYAHPISLFFYF